MPYGYVPVQRKDGNYFSIRLMSIKEFRKVYKKLEKVLETKFTIKALQNRFVSL